MNTEQTEARCRLASDSIKSLFLLLPEVEASAEAAVDSRSLTSFRITLAMYVESASTGGGVGRGFVRARKALQSTKITGAAGETSSTLAMSGLLSASEQFPSSSDGMHFGYQESFRQAGFLTGMDGSEVEAFEFSNLYRSPMWHEPLWFGVNIPKPFTQRFENFEQIANKNDSSWSFWNDWLLSVVLGEPFDRKLLKSIVKIEDEIWHEGPEAVAHEIERIKTEMLSEKLPFAETIELNPDTGKFRAIPLPVQNAPYMSALLSQISDALEDCLGGHNGLSERSGDIRKLNRVLTKYKDDPQNAELTLTRVAASLRGQLHHSRELPDNEDNLALLNAVEEGVRGIRANHPEVAANREQLAQQAFKALAPADKQVLEDAQPVLEVLSDPELADDFAQDIPELINDAMLPLPDGAPRLPGADAATRIFSRASKMATLWEQVNAARDSKAYRLAEVGNTASAAGTMLYKVVSLGLRLLGVI